MCCQPRGSTLPSAQRLVKSGYARPSYSAVSSSLATSKVRPTGGLSAATSRPWYRRVRRPATVPDAKPPAPLVQSHSRDSATARSPQISRPKSSMFIISLHLPRHVRPDGPGIAPALLDLVHDLASRFRVAGVVD